MKIRLLLITCFSIGCVSAAGAVPLTINGRQATIRLEKP